MNKYFTAFKAQKDYVTMVMGSIIVGLLLVYLTTNNLAETTLKETSFSEDVIELSAVELFEKGEYYFNHDDDPAGPYDIFKAKDYYEAAVEKDSKANPALWYQLGRVNFILGRFSEATENFESQVKEFPEAEINPNYMLGLVYGYRARKTGSDDDWTAAEEAFKDFIEYEPEAPWPRVDLAWIYFAQGKFQEMIPVLGEGLLYDSDNAWLHNMYGLAMLNTGDAESARMHFDFARTLASSLTPQQWGDSYPGNDPASWEQGLAEFRVAIEKNWALAEGSVQ